MAQNDLIITEASLTDDGQQLHLKVKARNPANRTRHVYASHRALRYDAATGILEVQMSDHGLVEPRELRNSGDMSPATVILPAFTTVDPKNDAEITMMLPRTIVRPSLARSTATMMKFDVLPIYEARSVKIDLAWSESPFYLDPRRPTKNREQLVEWAKGVAIHQLERSPARQ